VNVGRHVNRHVVDLGCKVGAVIRIKRAQEVLVRFAFTGVLRDDESGDVFQ
jgi:hypothetical protein